MISKDEMSAAMESELTTDPGGEYANDEMSTESQGHPEKIKMNNMYVNVEMHSHSHGHHQHMRDATAMFSVLEGHSAQIPDEENIFMNLTPQSVLAQVEVKRLQARPAQHKYSILDYFIGGTDSDTSLQWFDEKELSNSFLYYFCSPNRPKPLVIY